MKKRNPSARKLSLPVEWQVRPMSWGGARWQHRQETGDDVYDRTFPNNSDLEWYLADRYGWRFARKVLAALATSTGDPVGIVKRNPPQKGKGKKALKKAAGAVKRGAGALLGAGAEILKAGAEAMNPEGPMHPVLVKLNRRADKLKKPHMGEKGNQWRQLEFTELGDMDWPHIQRSHIPGVTIHATPPPGVVWFPSSRNYKKRNPRGVHLPGLPAKAQREYEHIVKSARAEGRYKGREKQVAARTVKKQFRRNADWPDLQAHHKQAAMRAWAHVVSMGPYRFATQFRKALKQTIESNVSHRGGVGDQMFNYAWVQHGGKWNEAPAKNPKRRRNLGHKDSDHPVEVKHHYRAGPPGYLTPWQRAHHAGQKDLFAHGIAPAKRRNSTEGIKEWEKAWGAYIKALKAHDAAKGLGRDKEKAARMRLAKTEKTLQKLDPDFYWRVIKDKGRNPLETIKQLNGWRIMKLSDAYGTSYYVSKDGEPGNSPLNKRFSNKKDAVEYLKKKAGQSNPRKGTRRAGGRASATARHKKELQAERLIDRYKAGLTNNHAAYKKAVDFLKGRRKSPNPSAVEIRKEFAGGVSGSRDLYFPQGTPSGELAKLGRLVSITTEEGTIKPVAGVAWLCADTRGKLHLGSTTAKPLYAGPARNFGRVSKIEYEEKKPHLGYGRNPIIWFHHVGEETGEQPTLRSDGHGYLIFKGGAYRITARGIEN